MAEFKPLEGWTFRYPVQVPEYITELMEALFPTVHVVYHEQAQQYGLVDYGMDGRYTLIGWIAGLPTLNKTVGYLCQNSIRRIQDGDGMDAFLEKVDAKHDEYMAEKESAIAEERREGSERLAAILASDHVVSFQGAYDDVPDSSEAGHEDPPQDR